MILTKKALPRRTFLRGSGAALALPLLDSMVPSMTALADTAASPTELRRLGFVYMPMGSDISSWTPTGRETLDELSPTLRSLSPVKQHVTVDQQSGIAERLPRDSCDVKRGVLERGKGKTYREYRLLPGNHRRSNCGPEHRSTNAVAIPGIVDGFAVGYRSM